MASVPNALRQLINSSQPCLLLISYHTLWLAKCYTMSCLPHYFLHPLGRYCFCQLRKVLCLCGQNCFCRLCNISCLTAFSSYKCLVPLWPKLFLQATQCLVQYNHAIRLLFPATDVLCLHGQYCFACYAMSRALCHSFFSPLLYWCLAWWCTVPVGITFAGNQITT